MPEKCYEKVIIYPTAQFVPVNPLTGESRGLEPVRFPWLNRSGCMCIVTVDEVLERKRIPAEYSGGHGWRYTCRVSWMAHGNTQTKQSQMWFDPRRLQWFVQVHIKNLWEGWREEFLALGQPPKKRRPRNAILASDLEGPTVRADIFPLVRFVASDEKTRQDYRLVPEQYEWDTPEGQRIVVVDTLGGMMRATELKHTQRGYRYSCYVHWSVEEDLFAQHCHLWFDAETLLWETDVPEAIMTEL